MAQMMESYVQPNKLLLTSKSGKLNRKNISNILTANLVSQTAEVYKEDEHIDYFIDH